jgi:hypothetical protein
LTACSLGAGGLLIGDAGRARWAAVSVFGPAAGAEEGWAMAAGGGGKPIGFSLTPAGLASAAVAGVGSGAGNDAGSTAAGGGKGAGAIATGAGLMVAGAGV